MDSIEGNDGSSGIDGAFSPFQAGEENEIQAFQDARIRALFEKCATEFPKLEMTSSPLKPDLSLWEKFKCAFDELCRQLKSYGVDTKELSEEKIREVLKGSSKRLPTLGEPQKDSLIIAINGMNTSLEQALSHQAYLRSLTGNLAAIDFIYNASYHLVIDLLEILALNYHGLSPNTAQLLYETWQEFAKNHPGDQKIFVPCHSQGAIHVYNALLLSPPELRNRIIVVTIAPAKIVPTAICCKSYNYASKLDVVHYGELLKMPLLDSDDPNFFEDLEKILAERAELILLEPHPDATGIDHDFQSPPNRSRA